MLSRRSPCPTTATTTTLVVVVAAVALALALPTPASAGTVTLISCPGGARIAPTWTSSSSNPQLLVPSDNCPSGRLRLGVGLNTGAPSGSYEQWSTRVPQGMTLRSFSFGSGEALVSTSLTNHPGAGKGFYGTSGFSARFLSAAGAVTFIDDGSGYYCCGGMDYARAGGWGVAGQSFALQVYCATLSPCSQPGNDGSDLLDIGVFSLVAEDDSPPMVVAVGANNVYYTGGHEWIRGSGWPASFTASDDAGICGMRVLVGGTSIQGPAFARNQSSWTQCPTPLTDSYTLDTTHYPDGPLSLVLSAADAASPANVSSPSTTLHLDNTPVGLSLTGPSDVAASAANASTAITATASAGPSGADIFCSVDGGPEVEYAGSSAQVPVSGLGGHQASCYAQNGAVDANGTPARSATQTFDLSIRQPTAQAATFAHIADALRCQRVEAKVKVRGKTRVVKRHGKKILIRGRVRTVKKRVRRCHARTVKRKVWVVLKHHGKVVRRHGKPVRVRRVRRVVVLPHVVFKAKQRIGHGKTTTVSGYLGLADGTPLANRVVSVIAAANNGLGQFTLPIATVTTNPSGVWTVKVPAGPSRLIEAIYAGSPTEEPAISAPITLTVPARIRLLSVTPRVPWGGTVHLVGKLYGGYLPPGGVAIRMRYGYGRRARATFGVLQHIAGTGRFATTFTFGPGPARVHVRYWFSASLLANANYAFAEASSSRHYVRVGGHPKTRRRHRKHLRHHKHKAHHR